MKYIYKMKSLKIRYKSLHNTNSLSSFILVSIIVGEGSVSLCIQLVRGRSNLLVANKYWMVAFKTLVFDVSLFEETPNRRNSEIWELFVSLMFSPVF